MSDARSYIDLEFEQMRQTSIKGRRDEGLEAVMKMVFIAGMSAALGFDGNDEDLGDALKPALLAISHKYGDRTIFPIEPNGFTFCNHGEGRAWVDQGPGKQMCGLCKVIRWGNEL
jgi:hypothetical protein